MIITMKHFLKRVFKTLAKEKSATDKPSNLV